MFVGYAELFNGKGSIICVFVKVHDVNIRKFSLFTLYGVMKGLRIVIFL